MFLCMRSPNPINFGCFLPTDRPLSISHNKTACILRLFFNNVSSKTLDPLGQTQLVISDPLMPLSYGMIFHIIYAVLQISPVSKVDSKPTYFRNHSHHSFLLPNTGPPLWERLGTCLMSYKLCLTNWMVCLRIR